jgi:Ca2+-binding RTX toxin-like protein
LVVNQTVFSLASPPYANIENLVGMGGGFMGGSVTLTGNDADNTISVIGPMGKAALFGGAGNDTLSGYLIGQDDYYGGAGNDTYVIGRGGDFIHENANEGIDTIDCRNGEGYTGLDSAENVENLLLGSVIFNGTYNGNAQDNFTRGDLTSSATYDGGAGADRYEFTSGQANVFVFDNAGDRVSFESAPTLVTGASNSISYSFKNNNRIESTASVDLAQQKGVHVARLSGSAPTGQALLGTNDRDVLVSDTGATLMGRGGNDTLEGSAFNDVYEFTKGDGQDVLIERGGGDALNIHGYNDLTLTKSGMDLVLSFTGQSDSITCTAWFGGAPINEIERITTDGGSITSLQINALIQAMASTAPAGTSVSTTASAVAAYVPPAVATPLP